MKDAATGIVSFKAKVSPLDEKWIGRPDNPDVGFVMLKSTPTGFPAVIDLTPVPDVDLRHVKSTYPHIGQDAVNWWEQFFTDQTFWCPDLQPAYNAGIWDVRPPAVQLIVPPPTCNGRPIEECIIHMRDQRLSSLEELKVGMLVAVHPMPGFYPNNADPDTVPSFWVAEITGFVHILIIILCFFSGKSHRCCRHCCFLILTSPLNYRF